MSRILVTLIFALAICMTGAPSIAARAANDYTLYDSKGTAFGLYPGTVPKGFTESKYMVKSLTGLEGRVKLLPAGSKIHWVARKFSSSGKPMLFGSQDSADEFQRFCASQHIGLSIRGQVLPQKK